MAIRGLRFTGFECHQEKRTEGSSAFPSEFRHRGGKGGKKGRRREGRTKVGLIFSSAGHNVLMNGGGINTKPERTQ